MTPADTWALVDVSAFALAWRAIDLYAASRGLLGRTSDLGPAKASHDGEPVPASQTITGAAASIAVLAPPPADSTVDVDEAARLAGRSVSWVRYECAHGRFRDHARQDDRGRWRIDVSAVANGRAAS